MTEEHRVGPSGGPSARRVPAGDSPAGPACAERENVRERAGERDSLLRHRGIDSMTYA